MGRLTQYTLAILTMAAAAHTSAQDGATALTQNYRTLLDNEQMQVVRVHYDPHEELPVHAHSRYPTVYVYLSNSGPVRFSHDEAHPFVLTRRAVRAGWFRVSPGRIEKHRVANLGPVASDFLRVECKQIALGQIRSEFRYSEDVDLTKTSVRTDYSSPEMVIRRYVVVHGGRESVAAEAQPQLLIAFAPAIVSQRGQPTQTMAAGSVLWMKAGASFDLTAGGAAAAHVLTIRLK
ncbi:MAG TPA: cupin domain-containing protein [Acidobacteriaceae bacterium]